MSVVTYYHVRFGVIGDDGNISVLYCQNKAQDVIVSNSGNKTYVPDVSDLGSLINRFNRWTFRTTDIQYSDLSPFVYNGLDCNVAGKILDARALKTHVDNKNNPHNVTKDQVGLGKCDNTSDSEKIVKHATSADNATNANHATSADNSTRSGHADISDRTFGVYNWNSQEHTTMFNWDGTDLWIYVDDAKNAIKLGPCGNDLSKKQDVNQYKTVKLTGKLTGNTNISFQTATWNGSYSESGWRMIALCGYHVSDGTVGEMFVDVSYQTINVTVTWNPQINADVTIDVWITCAPV